ncbi:MAG: DUF362 domain-containing protein [Oscillospiraceae bacterium]|nr:DUF362 domain-containing protein [Oscillospiraceae bacterium]
MQATLVSRSTELPEGAPQFSDVPADAWYTEAVRFVSARGLMIGIGEDIFSPEDTFTRAQLATVLWRIAGEPAVTGEDVFTDTKPGAWYADAVLWAEQQKVVNGIGGGLFAPGDPVTQEQMATMLWRVEGEPEAAAATDASDYAAAAVGWARETGVAPMMADYTFTPGETASRAQIAAVLYAYLEQDAGTEYKMDITSITTNSGTVLELTQLAHWTASGDAPVVYYVSDISSEALMEIYAALNWTPTGKVAVKISTGEPPASNYLRPELIKELVQAVNGTIVETNTAYGGRASTAMHMQAARDHGFTEIAEVDIMDADGEMTLPVVGGTRLKENVVGSHYTDYDSFVVLSHFKGHPYGGFGGAIKNTSIGIASREGKALIHTGGTSRNSYFGEQDPFLEAMAEAAKSVSDDMDHGEKIIYISVMNRLSVDCDCMGNPAEPDMHDIGILASYDPVALDQACVDLIYSVPDGQSVIRRIESRNGSYVLEHGEAIGLGSRSYRLVDIHA